MKTKSIDNTFDEDEFDFGFTSMSENELKQAEEKLTAIVQEQDKVIEDIKITAGGYEEKLNKMYKLIQPLLRNLAKDDGKDYIYWPDRKQKIEAFKNKLDNLMK